MSKPATRKRSYWALFSRAQNVDLAKDLGFMPHLMATQHGYDAFLLTYENGSYPWSSEVPGTRLVFLPKRFGKSMDVLLFLLKNAREIDVLHIEHLHSNANLIAGLFYKLLNPQGILYYKLDASPHIMEALVNRPRDLKSRLKTGFLHWMMRRRIDLVSVESRSNYERLTARFSDTVGKLMHLPNGCHLTNPPASPPKKKNIIFTAGRLGAVQKATEILLEGFARVAEPGDWRLVLAGPIVEGFPAEIDRLFARYPHLRERVDFAGYVTDRARLYQLYGEARIFCFPSRWEGFSHAVIEAAYFADYLIATDVGGVADALDVTGYGRIVPFDDPAALAAALQETITHWSEIERPTEEIQRLVNEKLTWRAQCERLHERLNSLFSKRGEQTRYKRQ